MSTRKTPKKLKDSGVYHFSVFMENKVGALLKIVKLLKENSIEIFGISLLDLSESGIVRIVVSDPEGARHLFEKHHIAYHVSRILLVELPPTSTDISQILTSLFAAEINVTSLYPLLIRPSGKSVLALQPDDMECATSVLMGQHFKLFNQSDISR